MRDIISPVKSLPQTTTRQYCQKVPAESSVLMFSPLGEGAKREPDRAKPKEKGEGLRVCANLVTLTRLFGPPSPRGRGTCLKPISRSTQGPARPFAGYVAIRHDALAIHESMFHT